MITPECLYGKQAIWSDKRGQGMVISQILFVMSHYFRAIRSVFPRIICCCSTHEFSWTTWNTFQNLNTTWNSKILYNLVKTKQMTSFHRFKVLAITALVIMVISLKAASLEDKLLFPSDLKFLKHKLYCVNLIKGKNVAATKTQQKHIFFPFWGDWDSKINLFMAPKQCLWSA